MELEEEVKCEHESNKPCSVTSCSQDQLITSFGEDMKEDALPSPKKMEEDSDLQIMKKEIEVEVIEGPWETQYTIPVTKKRKVNSSNSFFENKELIERAMNKLTKDDDECAIFGRYVASVMRNLDSETLRRKLKKRIQQLLLDITDEEYEHPRPSSVTSSYGSVINSSYSPAI